MYSLQLKVTLKLLQMNLFFYMNQYIFINEKTNVYLYISVNY
jgi:hypothetical protein